MAMYQPQVCKATELEPKIIYAPPYFIEGNISSCSISYHQLRYRLLLSRAGSGYQKCSVCQLSKMYVSVNSQWFLVKIVLISL